MKKAFSVFLLIGSSAQALSKDGKCRILSFRGGGVHGSWEVGVLKAVLEQLDPAEVTYDYVGGISIGAVNASLMALHKPGDEKQALEMMTELYTGRETKELFKFHKPSWVQAFRESSLAMVTPLWNIIKDTLAHKEFQRKLSIVSSDLTTGQTIFFDETMPLTRERVDGILSSTAVPFAFPPVHLDGMTLVDGSLFSTVSIGDPIERCREEVDDDKDIIVDVFLCYEHMNGYKSWTMPDMRWKNAYNVYQRRKEIYGMYYYEEDILRMTRGFHDVNFRLIVKPGKELTSKGLVPINATAKDILNEIKQGYKDGLKAVEELRVKEQSSKLGSQESPHATLDDDQEILNETESDYSVLQ